MKSVLVVMCEHTVTVGSKPSYYLEQSEGVQRFRTDATRDWALAPSIFVPDFCSVTFCGTQIQK